MEWLKIKNLIVLKNKLLINNYILKIKLKLGTLFNYEKCFTRYIKRLTGSNVANYGVWTSVHSASVIHIALIPLAMFLSL